MPPQNILNELVYILSLSLIYWLLEYYWGKTKYYP
jgi:hypothetical protein